MSFYATLILAFALSMDAFAVAICKGAVLVNPRFNKILRIGLLFGFIEAMTPIIGWAVGVLAYQYITQWDHWIAFGLLFILGLRMIVNGTKAHRIEQPNCTDQNLLSLILTAIATSIDAMAIGIGLAMLQVNILHTALTIGLTTMTMVILGIVIGKYVGQLLGKKAEIFGGVVLIAIGVSILFEHLGE